MLNNFTKYNSTHLTPTEVLYEFKVKKLLNLLGIDNLNLNDLSTPPDMPTIPSAERSKDNTTAITEASPAKTIKRAVAVRVPTVSTRHAFPANSESYRPQHINAQDALAFAAIRIK